MPSRRRPKSPPNPPATQPPATPAGSPGAATLRAPSDVERFAAAMKESDTAGRLAKAQQQQERTEAALRVEQAATKAAALAAARRELERAVEAVRTAKQVGRGRAEADQAWKVAKALVIELETGTPPAWAPKHPEPVETESVEPAEGSDELAVEVSTHSQ